MSPGYIPAKNQAFLAVLVIMPMIGHDHEQ
jgi:hypothetical protein